MLALSPSHPGIGVGQDPGFKPTPHVLVQERGAAGRSCSPRCRAAPSNISSGWARLYEYTAAWS